MWQQHLTILGILTALALPVLLIDRFLLKPAGGPLPVDLTGLLIIGYLLWLALHAAISSAGHYAFPSMRLFPLHAASALAAALALGLGLYVAGQIDKVQTRAKFEARQAERQKLAQIIQLEKWWIEGTRERPQAIGVVVRSTHSGRFAAGVQGRAGDYGNRVVYAGEMKPQQQMEAGGRIEYLFPLTYYGEEPAPEITLSFSLFPDSSGTAPENIFKYYESNPERADDGQRFRAPLPAPSPAPQ